MTVTVTKQTRQTIDGWGASVVGDTVVDPLVVPEGLSADGLARLDRLVFRSAGINLVRVFAPGYGTQLETGDLRPRPDDPRFAFMRRVAPLGVRFMLTGADAPADMKEGKALRHGSESAYAEYLAGVLRVAKDVGAPFTYAAVANEPDNPAALLTMTPEQTALVYARLAEQVETEDLGVALVLGDNTGWGDTHTYARAELALPEASGAAVAVASHAYGGSPEDMSAVAELARERDLSVWQTEWGTGCPTCSDERTIDSALDWSRQIATGLVKADASAWFTFRAVADSTHGPGDALIVRQRDHPEEPFYATKRFQVFRQYASAAPPGARRLEIRVDRGSLPAVAFLRGTAVTLVLTNSGSSAESVELDFGRRVGSLSAFRTSATEDFRTLPSRSYEGRPLRNVLPPRSVTSYALE